MIYNTVLESTTTDEVNYLAGIKLAKFDESMNLAECFATVIAESTCEWNSIMQESSIEALVETSRIVLEADGDTKDEKAKKSFKETALKLLNNVIEWVKSMGSKLMGLISKLLSKLESLAVSNKKLFGDKAKLVDAFDKMTDEQKKITVFFNSKLTGVNITPVKTLAQKETAAFEYKFLNQEDAEDLKEKIARFREDSEYTLDKYYAALIAGSDSKNFKEKLEAKYNTSPVEKTLTREDIKDAYEYATNNANIKAVTKELYKEVKDTINGIISSIDKSAKKLNKKTEVGAATREACSIYTTNMRRLSNVVTLCLNTYISAITKNMQGARAIAFRAYKVANGAAKAEKKADKTQPANASFMFDLDSSFNPELI